MYQVKLAHIQGQFGHRGPTWFLTGSRFWAHCVIGVQPVMMMKQKSHNCLKSNASFHYVASMAAVACAEG